MFLNEKLIQKWKKTSKTVFWQKNVRNDVFAWPPSQWTSMKKPVNFSKNCKIEHARRPGDHFLLTPVFVCFLTIFHQKTCFWTKKHKKMGTPLPQLRVFFVLKTFFWQKKCQKVKKHQKCVRDPQKWGPDPPFFGGGPYGVQGDFDALSWPGENVSSRGARKTYHLTPPTPGGVSDPVFGVKNTFLTRSLVIISPRTSKTSKSEAQTRVSGWFLDPKV